MAEMLKALESIQYYKETTFSVLHLHWHSFNSKLNLHFKLLGKGIEYCTSTMDIDAKEYRM